MELPITIRQAGPDDANELAELHLRSAQAGFSKIFPAADFSVSHEEMSADWLARLKADPASHRATLVAEVEGTIIGVLVAETDPSNPDVGRGSRLYIDPEYWNHAVAKRLLAAWEVHLRDAGCKVGRGWVMEPNRPAQLVFEGMGATRTGARQQTCEIATTVSDGVEDIEYELSLYRAEQSER
jgi:GNAT superfamily N-acetyltransferase